MLDVKMSSTRSTRGSVVATAAVTAVAPIAWGTTYVVVTELLPPDRPLLVAASRVGPAAVVLLTIAVLSSRWRPRGGEWLTTFVLSLCNFGLFFPLLIVAVYRLPGGVAAAAGGLQPLLVALGFWAIGGGRPQHRTVATGAVAALGVALVVVRPGADVDMVGVLAAVAANVAFSMGVVLTKRLPAPPDRIAAAGWQLLLGTLVLAPLALVVEGPPPAPTATNLVGFAYLSVVGTAVAFVVWFRGIARLPRPAPPLLGLASPLTGAAMGWVVLDQSLTPVQIAGFAITVGAIASGTLDAAASEAQPATNKRRPPAADSASTASTKCCGDIRGNNHFPANTPTTMAGATARFHASDAPVKKCPPSVRNPSARYSGIFETFTTK